MNLSLKMMDFALKRMNFGRILRAIESLKAAPSTEEDTNYPLAGLASLFGKMEGQYKAADLGAAAAAKLARQSIAEFVTGEFAVAGVNRDLTLAERKLLMCENYEFCIKNKDFCIKNEEFCIKNNEFCIKNEPLQSTGRTGVCRVGCGRSKSEEDRAGVDDDCAGL